MAKESAVDGFWVGGCNSALDSGYLKPTEFAWAINCDNSGGYVQTRHGLYRDTGLDGFASTPKIARGMAIFTAKGKTPIQVVARGDKLLHRPYPFTGAFVRLPGVNWRSTLGPVTFVTAVKSVKRKADGSKEVISPYPVLIIQDGEGRAVVWDGTILSESNPSKQSSDKTKGHGIPVGKWGAWIGNRYWVSNGFTLRASDLADPLSFVEEEELAGGGYLILPGEITGIGQTPDFKNLLVFTDSTTSSIQSSILDRTQWGSTPDFQRVILPNIGCAAGKSIANQYGLTWWYSHGGLMGLDQALQTYRSSRILFRDQQMTRSKGNLSPDISGICVGTFGNYLIVSVPSGDKYNAHTWVLNQSVLSTEDQGPAQWAGAWTGIRPVEWVTSVVNGESRCFCLSMDYGDNAQPYYTNVWEAFSGERADVNGVKAKSIQSSFETRLIGASPTLKRFEYAEVELSEIVGKVHLRIYYCGTRGNYKKVFDREFSASQGSPNGPEQVTAKTDAISRAGASLTVKSTAGFTSSGKFYHNGREISYTSKDATHFYGMTGALSQAFSSFGQATQILFNYDPDGESTILQNYVPQRRTVKTSTAVTPDGQAIESNRTEEYDRGFSLLFRWTGKMAVSGIRVVYDVEKEAQVGACQDDESSARYITDSGLGQIIGDVVQPEESFAFSSANRSRYLMAITPKHTEEAYSSLIR